MKPIYAFLFCLFTAFSAYTQSAWMASSGNPGRDEYMSASRWIPSGDVVTIGSTRIQGDFYLARLIKNNGADGSAIWAREYAAFPVTRPHDMVVHPQAMYSCGYAASAPNGDRDLMIAGFAPNGDSLFFKSYKLSLTEDANARDIDLAGNGLLIGGIVGDFTSPGDAFLVRADLNGDTLWSITTDFGGLAINHFMGVEQLGDKYYMAVSAGIIGNSSNNVAIAIFDTLGNFINITHEYGLGTINTAYNGDAFRVIPGNRFVLASNAPVMGGDGACAIFDATGAMVQNIISPDMVYGIAATGATNSSDLIMLGTIQPLDSVILERYTSAGGLVFHKGYRLPQVPHSYCISLEATPDGGFLLSGYYGNSISFGSFEGWVIKTDSMGNVLTNKITGKVFADFNGNCVQDPGEFDIPGVPVLLMPDSAYQLTDAFGRYSYDAYSGNYTVYPPNLYNIWNMACPVSGSYSVNFPQNNYSIDSLNNFTFQSSNQNCGLLQVDLSPLRPRNCVSRPASIYYNNIGTDTSYNAYIVLHLDPVLSLTGSSVPYTQNGNDYTFQLGNIGPFQNGTIYLQVFTDCNALVGSTACMSATGYPDTNCTAPGPNYDNSLIETQGYCIQGIGSDTVRFALRNIGTGGMVSSQTLTLYEDNIIFMTQPYQIPFNDSLIITIPVNTGKTYFLDTDQHPDYPGLSHPISFVEGCGNPQYSLGVIPQFPLYDLDPYYDLQCDEIINSLDPNDKTGFPLGFLAPNYITANDPMEYHIRFQNTGSDTCYLVTIKDTVSPYLDLSSFRPGSASHPYTVTMNPGRELVFRFENANLPDSATNPQGSQGFVNYDIEQVPGNTPGTEIHNTAFIYFDFNEAVITNTTLHTVELPSVFHPLAVVPTVQNIDVNIFPNPSAHWIRISSGEWQEGWEFSLWTPDGKLALQQPVYGQDQMISLELLAPGTYIYKLEDGKGGFSHGKIVKL